MARNHAAVEDHPTEAVEAVQQQPVLATDKGKRSTQVSIILTEEAFNRFSAEAQQDDRPLSKYLARLLNRWHKDPQPVEVGWRTAAGANYDANIRGSWERPTDKTANDQWQTANGADYTGERNALDKML